ncbi:MAG: hypothetical protein HQ534_07985 [Armatimonadetes bacterium]|nr:hypothetical protein [Armatimonadota bacterium]
MKVRIIVTIIIFIITAKLSGQDTLKNSIVYPTGISVLYGSGSYSQKDEYISKEKYSGSLPLFSLIWARDHQQYLYKLHMSYRNSSKIKNYNVSADITHVTINQGFLYPLKKKTLLNRDLLLWIGPTTDLFFFFNKPDIAVSGFDYAQSFALLLSTSVSKEAILKLKPDLQLESSLKITILSLGMRMVDSEEDDSSPVKLLTLFSGLNSSFDLGVRYFLSRKISLKLAYRSEIVRISAWEPLLSASDSITIGLTCKL